MADGAGPARLAIAWELHQVEHLAPWCELLRMPLLVTDNGRLDAVAQAYPGLVVEKALGIAMPDGLPALGRLIAERSPRAIFYSDLFGRKALRALFGGRRDAPRIVYVPHGFSEKRQTWAAGTAQQDVAVLYGQYAFDQLVSLGVAGYLHHFVVSGNVRAGYHRRHAAYFRAQVDSLGLGGPRPARTLVYAPTWQDAIVSSSYFQAFASFATHLPSGWRLIVKLHPHLERKAAAIDALAAIARGRDVHLVRANPLCYPFLDLADAYVGDMSSLAYDFLAYDRPMFFTNATAGSAADAAKSRLFDCGTVIPPERYDALYRVIDEAWTTDAERFSEKRASLDAYAHATPRDDDDLRDEMVEILAGVAPSWMVAKLAPPRGAAS